MGRDGSGFDAFAASSVSRLLGQAYLLAGDYAAAEDLVQETLERVFVAWPRIEDPLAYARTTEDPLAYARTTLVRRTINRWRSRARRPEVPLEAGSEPATARTGGMAGAPAKWVKADGGLTVASFFQHTNRSIGPHLHQHNVILNRVLWADGKYRAIDGKDLLDQRYAASAVADRVLMERMAAMGFEVRLNAEGTARKLAVVPQVWVPPRRSSPPRESRNGS